MSDSSSGGRQRWHARTWWQVVGVVLTALGVVVAVLQLVATPDPPSSAASPAPVGDRVSAPPTRPPAAPLASAPTSSGPASSAAGAVRWKGPITFTEAFDTSTDLDLVPAQTTTADDDGDIHAGGTSGMLETEGWVTDYDGSSVISEWSGGGKPDFAACRERALAGGTNEVREVRKGTSLCVRTSEDRIALITITKVLKFQGYNADAVVWDQ